MSGLTSRAGRLPLLPPEAAAALLRRTLEGAGIALVLAALALLVALASYRPTDPSLNTASGRAVHNLLGAPGAIVADMLLQAVGLAAAALVLVLAGWGWRLLRRHELGHLWLRLTALPAAVLAAAAALAALPAPASWPLEAGLGGFAGALLLKQGALAAALAGSPLARPLAGGLAGVGAVLLLIPLSGIAFRDVGRLAAALIRQARGAGAAVAGFVGSAGARFDLAARARRGEDPDAAAEEAPEPALAPRREARIEPRLSARPSRPAGAEPGPRERAPEAPGAERERPTLVVPRAERQKPGKRARAERQGRLALDGSEEYRLPPLDLLDPVPEADQDDSVSAEALAQNARLLESVLEDFGVEGRIVKVRPGPVVALYELEPAPGTKTSRVIGLADDIARSMSAVSVRVAVIPGRNVIGIELPNARRETVYLRDLLAADEFEKAPSKLTLALGKDIGGANTMVDLARMPHLLIAGTTGSGKSVAINAMILSLLYRLTPDQCRFIMIDPKMLELSVYDGIPHLLAPVVTEAPKAVVALKWTVREMESRYRAMSQLGVRNIAGYNARIAQARKRGEVLTRRVQTGFDAETGRPIFEEEPLALDPLPLVVVVVDEMADLMLVAGKDIEAAIQRLSQMARAAGIHLIMATQRPSVDVITGTIKANFPTRISFQVTSKIDSRTILGEQGAEQLLGQGDMLYMAGGGRLTRIHGPFVNDAEVEGVVRFLKSQGEPAYDEAVTEEPDTEFGTFGAGGNGEGEDALYDQAVALVLRERKASTSFVQRHLQIGYNRAARLIDRMEAEGVVGAPNHVGKREILAGGGG
ncbi:MAG: DNA translocase FtsK 4TM domain-containing protein [Proteobacteria bacterium]|nr:DNA translocase FtsK 4TM domain-containing protein [Pseudomonadota bacterium]